MTLDKQAVLITGATSGIGYEFALIFAKKGYNLVLASRNKEKLSEIKHNFERKYNTSVVTIPIDLSENNSAQKLFDESAKQNIEVDILINNAGVGRFGEHVDLDISNVQKMLHLNIITLTQLCILFGRLMKERRHGFILNIASTAAYQPLPLLASYGASKSYVLNFSEALSKELEEYNVVVTCLSPGFTKTDFFTKAGIGNEIQGFFSLKRRMAPRKVADYGVKALFSRKLSVIPGLKNNLLAFSTRFAPRSIVAKISKNLTRTP